MAERLLFIDPVATASYDADTLETSALGGTEATVVRIAHGLSASHDVTIAQRARRTAARLRGVDYVPYAHKQARSPVDAVDAIVVVRGHKLLPALRRRFPRARLFLWMHCLPGKRLRRLAATCVGSGATLVAVSDDHLRTMQDFFRRHDQTAAGMLRAVRVYNPVAPEFTRKPAAVDHDKLLFLSSPHKGLDQVVVAFRAVRQRCPSLRLHVANPGYLHWPCPAEPGVIELGPLTRMQVAAELRSALCLFYPQDRFRETFGLVFAEARAVGTPVLAHPHGAAREVIDDPRQLCDARDLEAICNRILRWRSGDRPDPEPPERFGLHRALAEWARLIGEGSRVRIPHPADLRSREEACRSSRLFTRSIP